MMFISRFQPSLSSLKTLCAFALLVLLPGLVWIPSLSWGYVSDDFFILTATFSQFLHNPFLNLGRPMWSLSNIFIGDRPFVHHLLSVMLYVAIGFLFFRFALSRALSWAGILCLAAFLFHPAAIFSVSWISQRNDLLVVLFSLLAYQQFLRDRTRVSVITAFQVLASASKTPFVYHNLVYIWHFWREKKYTHAAILLLASAVFTLAGYLTYYVDSLKGRFADLSDLSPILRIFVRIAKIGEGFVSSIIPYAALATSLTMAGVVIFVYLVTYSALINHRELARGLLQGQNRIVALIVVTLAASLAFNSELRVVFPVVVFIGIALAPLIRTSAIGITGAAILLSLNLYGTYLNYDIFKSACMRLEPCTLPTGGGHSYPLYQFYEWRDGVRKSILGLS